MTVTTRDANGTAGILGVRTASPAIPCMADMVLTAARDIGAPIRSATTITCTANSG
jgi:hypothetical protein